MAERARLEGTRLMKPDNISFETFYDEYEKRERKPTIERVVAGPAWTTKTIVREATAYIIVVPWTWHPRFYHTCRGKAA